MNILIELNLNNSFSLAACVSGNVNLCDGAGNLTISGTSYLSNYLQELSPFAHSVNLLHGGNLEDYESFSFSFTDDGLTYELEKNDYSMNQGTVAVFTWDGTTKIPQWKGYVTGTELGENKITVKCENLSKGLKTLSEPVIYGATQKLKLSSDTSIPKLTLQFHVAPEFTDPGIWTDHPTIAEVGSPLFTFTGSITAYGLKKTKSTSSYIIVKSINDPFYKIPSTIEADPTENLRYYFKTPLKVSYLSGGNSGKTYRVKYLTQYYLGGFWYNKMYLKDDFSSTDFKAFDRISISNNVTYFRISKDIGDLTNAYVKIDDVYYALSFACYDIRTINGLKYLAIYPTELVYRELPISSIEGVYTYEPGNGTEVATTITANSGSVIDVLDNDFSNPFSYYHNAPADITSVIGRYTIKADLSKAYDKAIHLGLNINFNHMTHGTGDYGFQTAYQVTLKDGNKLEPYSDWGRAVETIASGPLVVCKVQTAPYGDITGPNTVNDASYPPGNLAFDKVQFDKYKLDIDAEIYKDVDSITLQTRMYAGDGNGNPSRDHTFYKIGLYVEESVEDIDEIYIDTMGKCNYLIPSFNFGAWPIGSNDAIAKDILTTLGQTSTSGFKFNPVDYVLSGSSYVVSGANHNHFYADSGTKSSDALETLAKEGLFVIAAQEDGTIYSRPLIMHQDDSKVNWSIPADDIISIEPLTDVEVSDIINLPTINFTDSAGNAESVEVISLDTSAFPSLASVNDNERSYSSVFKFSDNFLTVLKSSSISSNPIDHAYNFLSVMWAYCWNSYKKNGISNSGSIDISTYYLSELLNTPNGITDDCAQMMFFNLVQMNAMRRKQLKFTLPLDYSISKKIRIGDRIKVYHPNIMQNNSIYGFVSTVETELLHEGNQVSITLLCDSYRLGNGEKDFFGI